MTLILGFRCSDGVLIAADRKVMRGGEADYADKIFERAGVALAFEGLTGIRDDFLLLLDAEMRRSRGFESLYEVKVLIEDIVLELSRRYGERLGEEAGIGVLLGGLEALQQGAAQLYFVHPQGYGEAVSYRCAGHAEQYAHSLAKFLHDPRQPADANVIRAAFVVSYVSDDVDITVGGGPQVAIIRHNSPKIQYADDSLIGLAVERAKHAKAELASILGLSLGG